MRLDGTLAELVDNAGGGRSMDSGKWTSTVTTRRVTVADDGCGCDATGIGALGGHRIVERTVASEKRFTGGPARRRGPSSSLGDTCTVISYQGLVFHVGLLRKDSR